MKNGGLTPIAAVLLLAAGCTPEAGTEPAVTPPAPQTSAASSSPAPSIEQPTTTSPPQVDPVGVCPDGRYVLTRFSGTGLGSTKITGTGNDLKASFADGAYLMRAAGRSPYTLVGEKPGEKAKLTMKGTMRGSFSGVGDELSYKVLGAQGTAELEAEGQTRKQTMTQLTKTLAPSGKVPTTCAGDKMTIPMKTITLELEKI